MTLEYFIITFGYPAVMLGTFFEGETVLIIAGYLAHNGYLKLQYIILSAFIGSFAGDQLYFFLGRIKGQSFIDKRPGWKMKIEKFNRLLQKFHTPLILGVRFLYGLRIVGPFVIGTSNISIFRFMLLNAAGVVIWAILISSAGYAFGHTLEVILADIKHYELYVILFIMLVSIIFGWRSRRNRIASTL